MMTIIHKIPYKFQETKQQYRARLLTVDLKRRPEPEPQPSGPTFTFRQHDFQRGGTVNLKAEYMRAMRESMFRGRQ